MSVSVETLEGLERKMTVSIPASKIEEATNDKLKSIAPKVKVDGFRPGKVPMHIVKSRYAKDVRLDVARGMIQKVLFDAIDEQKLKLAGYPSIEPEEVVAGSDFTFHATFEVMPEISITELEKSKTIEVTKSEVTDSDLDDMIEKLREQAKEWKSVKRKSQSGDKANIDFKGFLGEEAFEGGEAKGFDLELGSGSMIPGFEDAIVGAKAGDEIEFQVTFPEDYGQETLAGKEATFKVTINEIQSAKLPKLDDDFAKQFNIEEGGVEALKKDVRQNMERELERKVSSINRDRLFEALLEVNAADLPKAMIDREIEQLKREMYHRVFGHEHRDDEKIPDFPRELFEEQAQKRVHLGLLFSEYVKAHNIEPEEQRVSETLDRLANAYVDPQEFRDHYMQNDERMGEIKALVTEEIVAEKIGEHATLNEVSKSYDEVMNPKQDTDEEGEE